jgi:hypothetical protein
MVYTPHCWLDQNNAMVVALVQGDVNGDEVTDNIYLTGEKNYNSDFVENFTLLIEDGKTGTINCIPLRPYDAGFDPKLFLGDFTGNGVKDIMISITSGGTGGLMYYYIYSYIDNVPELIFDYNEFSYPEKYEVVYRDYYKVEILNITNGIKFVLDISTKGQDYLDRKYNEDGTLKKDIEGSSHPLSELFPIAFDLGGAYQLLARENIIGTYNADALGFIQSILKWNGSDFALEYQYASVWGE